ncbi:hypothetical protein K2173_012688 [Erythroxylum novogranatense]|uniref:Dirigent protein n=1 Tax=Erythroxylum novogranatense TaxID=1862640 RepID=A0AAV8TJL4_9ROSI|nr:hypothetical protein K2173_012688 [Erythroxylum novogranatense]
MAQLFLVFLLVCFMAVMSSTQSYAVETWVTRAVSEKDTTHNLQFYFHDTLSGNNPSAVRVAQSTATTKSPTFFGSIMMADDPLTETADPTSKLVGRAQGIYGSASQNDVSLIMAMSLAFTDGIYNGSSLSLFGKNPAMSSPREMPIVGGTGIFRLARGYAIAQTVSANVNGDAIVGYNVTALVDNKSSGVNQNVEDSPSSVTGNSNGNTKTSDANFSDTVCLFLNHISMVVLSVFMVWSSF